MRLTFILLFICSVSFGQYTAKDNGATVTNGSGLTVMAQFDNIPTSPIAYVDPVDPESDSPDTVNIIGIGNSIYNESGEVYGLLDAMEVYDVTNLAYPGDKIDDQEYSWDTLVTNQPSVVAAAHLVIVGVGINNIADDSDVNDIEDDYQAFIDNIRADVSDSCKIIAATLTPARSNVYMSEQDYAEWLTFNAWMIASLTDADYIVTDNTSDLNDGSGNLIPAYNISGDGIHPSGTGQWIMVENFIEGIAEVGLIPRAVYFENHFDRTPDTEYTEAQMNADYTSNGYVDNTLSMTIEVQGTDTVRNSFYEEDHMGVGPPYDDDPTLPSRGVGMNSSWYFNDDYSGYKVVAKSQWKRWDVGFDVGRAGWVEMKMDGMRAGGSQYEAAVVRTLMNGDWSNDDHYYIRWYIQTEDEANEDQNIPSRCVQVGATPTANGTGDTARIVPGEWTHFTYIYVMNDSGDDNGLVALYINKQLKGYYSDIEFQIDNNLYWDRIEDCTFIGGEDDINMAPDHDQNAQTDDEIVWDPRGQLPNPNYGGMLPDEIVLPSACEYDKHSD